MKSRKVFIFVFGHHIENVTEAHKIPLPFYIFKQFLNALFFNKKNFILYTAVSTENTFVYVI